MRQTRPARRLTNKPERTRSRRRKVDAWNGQSRWFSIGPRALTWMESRSNLKNSLLYPSTNPDDARRCLPERSAPTYRLTFRSDCAVFPTPESTLLHGSYPQLLRTTRRFFTPRPRHSLPSMGEGRVGVTARCPNRAPPGPPPRNERGRECKTKRGVRELVWLGGGTSSSLSVFRKCTQPPGMGCHSLFPRKILPLIGVLSIERAMRPAIRD